MSKKNDKLNKERYNLLRGDKKFGITQVFQIIIIIVMLGGLYLLLSGYHAMISETALYIILIIGIFGFISIRLFK